MTEEWLAIEKFNSLPKTDWIYCDTRDFAIVCTNSPHKKCYENLRYLINNKLTDDCKFRKSEILGLLASLKASSGGEGRWRHLAFGDSWEWIKYIRFKKLPETIKTFTEDEAVYVAYLATGQNVRFLTRTELNPDNINEEALNFMK